MRSAPRSRFLPAAGACIVWVSAALAPAARAQADGQAQEPAARLKPSPQLNEALPTAGGQTPTFLFGQRLSSQPDVRTVIEGQAEVRQAGTSIRADRLDLEAVQQRLTTEGPVRVQASGNLFVGSALDLRLDTFEGFFSQPQYQLRNGANGQAQRIEFLGQDRLRAQQASYTSCERDNEDSWQPAWQLSAERLHFDLETEVGRAYKPVLRFYDVPILGWGGSLSFPLSDKRKSGLLPPSYVLDTTGGLSLTLPYYLDIAPNRDATITPTWMSKRGLDLGTELRYLERGAQGSLRANVLSNDRVAGNDRWSYAFEHTNRGPQPLADGWLNYSLKLNRASDGSYWRDFPRFNKSLTQRLLANDLQLNWTAGDVALGLRTLSWQTLQTADSVITPPYDRLPQLTARLARSDVPVAGLQGLDWSIDGDFTRFQALGALTRQTNADRLVTRMEVSRPWNSAAWSVTPKLKLHATQYDYTSPWYGAQSASRVVPTFSLDSALQFERQASFGGRGFLQTLEPRAFYVYTPYRDQRRLPNYDSAENSFSFASVFTENRFVGNDRIADANLLTLGVTSRLIEPESGFETLRAGVAQRIRFTDQQVTLDGSPPPVDAERLSDVLVGATVNWSQRWALNFTTQYNPKLGESQRTAVGTRYSPSPYRVVSASYKRQRPLTTTDAGSQQVDLGWQWPINDLWGDRGQDLGPGRGQGGRRWYSVGRLNYSMIDRRVVDTVMGVEYDGCCWIGRAVLQRVTSGLSTANTQLMVQLELVGFSRIGNNPLNTLRTQVPRYQLLREQVSPPSRYTHYE